VVVDPQVDFLSTKAATWKLVGKSVEANQTVKDLEILFMAAKTNDIPIFVSPHYYYPWDQNGNRPAAPARSYSSYRTGTVRSQLASEDGFR
jgi:hypothetical protein